MIVYFIISAVLFVVSISCGVISLLSKRYKKQFDKNKQYAEAEIVGSIAPSHRKGKSKLILKIPAISEDAYFIGFPEQKTYECGSITGVWYVTEKTGHINVYFADQTKWDYLKIATLFHKLFIITFIASVVVLFVYLKTTNFIYEE